MTVIYPARKIVTMNPARPHASHVAVRDSRIIGAGTLEELAGWGAYSLDGRFADKVLMPGLVEGHGHTMEGSFWAYVYCGYFDRMNPEGRVWPGLKSIDEIVARLREAADLLETPTAPPPAGRWTRSTMAAGASAGTIWTRSRPSAPSGC